MLAGPLAALQRLRLLSRGGRPISVAHCAKVAGRVIRRAKTTSIHPGKAFSSSAAPEMADTPTNGAGAATVAEVEALRKQVEDLKVRCAHLAGNHLLHRPRSPGRRVVAPASPPSPSVTLTPSLPSPPQIQLKKKEDEALLVAPYSRSYGRTMVSTILDSESEGAALVGRTVRVGGWVKTGRAAGAGAFAFLEVNDGSCFANLQVMVDAGVAEEVGGLKALVPTSTCVLIEGVLSETPPGTKQKVRFGETRRVWARKNEIFTHVNAGRARVAV